MNTAQISLLYMENDPQLAKRLQDQFGKLYQCIDIVRDGRAGLQKYHQKDYDVIIVRDSLPEYNGLEVLEQMAENGFMPPTILLTSSPKDDMAMQALKLGASDCVAQDVHDRYLDLLPILIENALRRQTLLLEKQTVENTLHRFKVLVEKSSELTIIINEELQIAYASPTVLSTLGYTVDEVLGASFDLVHPDDLSIVVSNIEGILIGPDNNIRMQVRVRHKDQSWKWLDISATHLLDEPLVKGMVVNARDITDRKQAQLALQKNEASLRAFIEAMPDVAIIFDEEGYYQEVLNAQEDLLYNSQQEFQGKRLHDILPEETAQVILATLQKTIQTKRVQMLEYKLDAHRGICWFEGRASLIQPQDEQDKHKVIWVARDITSRKWVEDDLKTQQTRLRTLYEIATLPSTNIDEKLEKALEAGTKLLGLSAGIISRIEGDHYTVTHCYTDPQSGMSVHRGDVYRLGDTYCNVTFHSDDVMTIHHANASQYATHPCYLMTGLEAYIGLPLDVNSKRLGTINFSSPMPYPRQFSEADQDFVRLMGKWICAAFEQEHIADVLRSSEERFRLIFEYAPIGIALCTFDNMIHSVNKAFCDVVGYTPEELSSMHMADLVHPDDMENNLKLLNRSLNQHSLTGQFPSYTMEERYMHKDGTIRDVYLQAAVLNTSEGEPEHIIGQVVDITERKKAENRLTEYIDQLELLREIDAKLNETLELEQILFYLLDTSMRMTQGAAGFIALSQNDTLSVVQSINIPQDIDLTADEDIARIIQSPRAEFVSDDKESAHNYATHPTSRMIIPLYSHNRLVAILSLSAPPQQPFKASNFEFVRDIAMRTAVAIDKAQLYQQTQLQLLELQELHKRISHQAHHDALTGLPNRLYFQECLQEAVEQALVNKEKIGLLYVDLDGFKRVNDTLGHPIGDKLLKVVAYRLEKGIRQGDMVARMGGDEFTIMLNPIKETSDAVGVAQRLLKIIRQPYLIDGHQLIISTSIGLSFFPEDGLNPAELLRNADSALYRSKSNGKNTLQLYESNMSHNALKHLAIGYDLHNALENNELILFYQPQVDVGTRKVVGFEGLLRWQHPKRGLLSPDKFLGIAEDMGLLNTIGTHVLETGCEQVKTFCEIQDEFLISINIAISQFEKDDFVETVAGILQKNDVDPQNLQLEVTEHSMLSNIESAAHKLNALRDLGIKIALDDFGVGYSSLNYIQRLSIDTLKIDRSLIENLTSDSAGLSKAQAIVSSLITLCKTVGIKVVAEGVEREEQFGFLAELGCDQAQGYLISKALPIEAIPDWLGFSILGGSS